MLNTQKARMIVNEAARLMELTATFQARYGRNYELTPETPAGARELADDIMNAQGVIAGLLDAESLSDAHFPYGQWWMRDAVLPLATAQQLVFDASRLLAAAIHAENAPNGSRAGVEALQRAVAGMLHPSSYRVMRVPQHA